MPLKPRRIKVPGQVPRPRAIHPSWNVGETRIALVHVSSEQVVARTGAYQMDGVPHMRRGTQVTKNTKFYPVLLRRTDPDRFDVVKQGIPYGDPKIDSGTLARLADFFKAPAPKRMPLVEARHVSGLKA